MANNENGFYVRELLSEECACGRIKKPWFAFCFKCYNSLPKDLQNGLFQKIGNGYNEAYDDAVEYLTEN